MSPFSGTIIHLKPHDTGQAIVCPCLPRSSGPGLMVSHQIHELLMLFETISVLSCNLSRKR